MKGQENFFHVNGNRKGKGAIFISDQIDFKEKDTTKDKGHHIILTGSIYINQGYILLHPKKEHLNIFFKSSGGC